MDLKLDTLTRWHRVSPDKLRRVQKRVQMINKLRPLMVVPICSYGWANQDLRISLMRVDAVPLKTVPFKALNALRYQIRSQFHLATENWMDLGFVHGDLSPDNILIERQPPFKLWFTDWLWDLKSFAGKPRFASHEVFCGRHSHDSDRYALQMTCAILGI